MRTNRKQSLSTATRDVPLVALDGSFLHLPPSGIGTYVRSLADAFAAMPDLPVDVHLIEPSPGRLLKPGSRAHRFLWDAFGVTGTLLAQHPRPRLLHLPQFTAPIAASVPYVVTIHDVIPLVLPDYRASGAMRVNLAVMSRTVKRAVRVIAPSDAAAEDITRVLGISQDRVRVIPEAASSDLAPDRAGAARAFVRNRFGIDGPYVFNIGGYDLRKNLPLLVRAFAQALPQLPDPSTTLVIAGAPHAENPRMFPPLEPIVAELGLGDRVRLVGRVTDDERRALYQAASVYATPSSYEGFGLTPLEAMACGVPPIVANRTSLPEVVGDAGLIVEPTVEAFAEAIVRIFRDDALRRDLTDRSLARAATFSWERAARETADIYREAIGGAR